MSHNFPRKKSEMRKGVISEANFFCCDGIRTRMIVKTAQVLILLNHHTKSILAKREVDNPTSHLKEIDLMNS